MVTFSKSHTAQESMCVVSRPSKNWREAENKQNKLLPEYRVMWREQTALVQAQSEKVCISMDCFVGIVDLMPFIMEEKACIQFLFEEGLLNKRMICNECYARLCPKDCSSKNILCLYTEEVIRK